jgi:hypothetical protein
MSKSFEPTLTEHALRNEYTRQFNDLVAKAEHAGFTIDLVTRTFVPLAMGHYRQYITVHYANQLYRRTS